jgi:hypothetical protein
MLWRNLHFFVGTLGLVLFALQGQYMAYVIEVTNMADTQRMLYRSAHIYFMAASGMNVCIGCYLSESFKMNRLQLMASVLILLAPVLLLLSFFIEINTESIDRDMLTLGLYALFGGAAILGANSIFQRMKSGSI